MDYCYNYGKELTEDNSSNEHIPAKNLFNGYPENYKQNRIIMPACIECNHRYSKIDQEIRANADLHQQELTRQAVKLILRRNDWKDHVFRISAEGLLHLKPR